MVRTLRYFNFTPLNATGASAAVFPAAPLLRLYRYSHSRHVPSTCVPAVLSVCGAGIFTCCPSDTALALSLGPDLPRADQLYPGNLGHPAGRIPTFLSLLIPAFSLPVPPPPLAGTASPATGMLPYHPLKGIHGFGGVFQPRTFSAQGLSASELLRTL